MKFLLSIIVLLLLSYQPLLAAERVKNVKSMKPGKTTADEKKDVDPVSAMEFVKVPGGCFTTNGSQVCVEAFSIGKYEVTQGVWQAVTGNNPSSFRACGSNCPIENVSWRETQDFIQKLNSRSGKKYRLPTEAEWEYACRSGGKDEVYCGSNNLDAVAWYGGNSRSQTHPVGQKKPNGLGIYDMSGNVWEWCQDWYDNSYPNSSIKQSDTPAGGSKVLRGGSWIDIEWSSRSVSRGLYLPEGRSKFYGFRLVSAP